MRLWPCWDSMGRDPRRVGRETLAITLGADKGYQFEDFVTGLRERAVVPHVAEYKTNDKFPNWLREEERNHPGFAVSQKKRKLVEKIFGWGKGNSLLRQVKLRGEEKAGRLRPLAGLGGESGAPDEIDSGGVSRGSRVSAGG